MKRRRFLQTMSGGLAGALIAPRRAFAETRLDHIGLELYAVRNAMKANPTRTLAAVRAIGYNDVELLWSMDNFGLTPQQTKATLDHEGLRAPSAHIAPEVLLTDWDKSLDTAHLLGHQYLIVPSLTPDTEKSLDAWRVWADRFNTAGAAARKANVWLAFHNEPEHMKPIDGKVPYDVFIERLDPKAVRLQLDVGNMMVGGGDPVKYFAKYRDWYGSFHLKDTVANHTTDTELGTGVFDFKSFLRSIPNLANKPCYVEQENPKDEMASARMNYRYLRSLNF
jgi:sugar phosphate isomerase/epimerase